MTTYETSAVFAVVALSILGVAGDVLLKQAGAGPSYADARYLAGGAVAWCAAGVGWFFVFKHLRLVTAGVVYAVSTVLLLALADLALFGGRLSLREALGVVLAVGAVLLLARVA